jgi:O2-independent ubiquinone biosynthesis protein UbiU
LTAAAATLRKPELVCPAGSLRALQVAIDAGADAVYMGLKDSTNARNFAGLNFDLTNTREGIRYAHARGRKVLMALNTFADARDPLPWFRAVDAAADLGIDALILADVGVMAYAARTHPGLRLHLSVQTSATNYEAIEFYRDRYNIQRAVLPRVLTASQVSYLIRNVGCEIEVFGFGSLCVMVEGRCLLSSYATGQSPNNFGACSPGAHVQWVERADHSVDARLNGIQVNHFEPTDARAYPTVCKGRYVVAGEGEGKASHAIEEPTSLNTLSILPELMAAGVAAIKIEGRQRSPAYVEQVTRVWRAAIDDCHSNPARFTPRPAWNAALGRLSEGQQVTLGAYSRPWK